MEENKNKKQYNSTDIQKYLEGKLSPAEMHAMEMAALDDPLLGDAMEGIQSTEPQKFNNDIEELKKRIAEKISKKENKSRIVFFRTWQRIAAAGFILIGMSGVIYYYIQNNQSKTISIAAKKENANLDTVVSLNKNVQTTPDSLSVGSISESDKKTEKRKEIPKARAIPLEKGNDQEKKEAPPQDISNSKPGMVANEAKQPTVERQEAQRRMSIVVQADSATFNLHQNPDSELKGKSAGAEINRASAPKKDIIVRGIVLDENKKPIIGATIKLKNNKKSTTTDENGQFELNANNKDSITNVIVNSVGFESASVALNNNTNNNIIKLQPSKAALSEVVVMGYSSSNVENDESNSFDKITSEPSFKAEPNTGWLAYNDYINKNKKITTADSIKKGKEIISFLVDTNNQLSNFKIKKSLSPAHDSEAIRLVKEGPTWKLLKKKKTKVTLVIEF